MVPLDCNIRLSKCLLTTSILSLLLVSSDGLFQYLTGADFFKIKKKKKKKISGLFGNEPIMGRYIAHYQYSRLR